IGDHHGQQPTVDEWRNIGRYRVKRMDRAHQCVWRPESEHDCGRTIGAVPLPSVMPARSGSYGPPSAANMTTLTAMRNASAVTLFGAWAANRKSTKPRHN